MFRILVLFRKKYYFLSISRWAVWQIHQTEEVQLIENADHQIDGVEDEKDDGHFSRQLPVAGDHDDESNGGAGQEGDDGEQGGRGTHVDHCAQTAGREDLQQPRGRRTGQVKQVAAQDVTDRHVVMTWRKKRSKHL